MGDFHFHMYDLGAHEAIKQKITAMAVRAVHAKLAAVPDDDEETTNSPWAGPGNPAGWAGPPVDDGHFAPEVVEASAVLAAQIHAAHPNLPTVESEPDIRCPDCAVAPGQLHDDGCDVARCWVCRCQRLMCAGGHYLAVDVWTGTWPTGADGNAPDAPR